MLDITLILPILTVLFFYWYMLFTDLVAFGVSAIINVCVNALIDYIVHIGTLHVYLTFSQTDNKSFFLMSLFFAGVLSQARTFYKARESLRFFQSTSKLLKKINV